MPDKGIHTAAQGRLSTLFSTATRCGVVARLEHFSESKERWMLGEAPDRLTFEDARHVTRLPPAHVHQRQECGEVVALVEQPAIRGDVMAGPVDSLAGVVEACGAKEAAADGSALPQLVFWHSAPMPAGEAEDLFGVLALGLAVVMAGD